MLAYDPGISIDFDITPTILFLLAAVTITSCGLAIAGRGGSIGAATVGGIVVGGGIADMHYLGMSAVLVPGRLTWSADLVAASILLGAAFGAAALMIAAQRKTWSATLGASLLLTLAIASLHFTAMGAVDIVPDPLREADTLAFSPRLLAIAIALIAIGLLTLGIGGIIIDRRMRDQSLQLKTAMDNMRQGLLMFDADGRLVIVNRRYAEMYRLPPDVIAPGRTLLELLEERRKTGTFQGDGERCAAEALEARGGHSHIFELPDGRTISMTTERMENGGWVATDEDITARGERRSKSPLHGASRSAHRSV